MRDMNQMKWKYNVGTVELKVVVKNEFSRKNLISANYRTQGGRQAERQKQSLQAGGTSGAPGWGCQSVFGGSWLEHSGRLVRSHWHWGEVLNSELGRDSKRKYIRSSRFRVWFLSMEHSEQGTTESDVVMIITLQQLWIPTQLSIESVSCYIVINFSP